MGGELHTFTNNERVITIHSDDEELFKKCREIQNKITKLRGINNALDFVETANNGDEFIMVDVHENAGTVKFGYKKLNINTPIKHINKHIIKIFNQCTYTINITFFSLIYRFNNVRLNK